VTDVLSKTYESLPLLKTCGAVPHWDIPRSWVANLLYKDKDKDHVEWNYYRNIVYYIRAPYNEETTKTSSVPIGRKPRNVETKQIANVQDCSKSAAKCPSNKKELSHLTYMIFSALKYLSQQRYFWLQIAENISD
jgi:hypothetical protein